MCNGIVWHDVLVLLVLFVVVVWGSNGDFQARYFLWCACITTQLACIVCVAGLPRVVLCLDATSVCAG